MADPFSVKPTDEAGSGDGSGTDVGVAATGGLLCPLCGTMIRTVPPESEETDARVVEETDARVIEETDARVEEDQYCNCEEAFASFGMELLTITDPTTTAAATGSSTTFYPTVQVINFPMDEGTSGVNITEIPLADEPNTKNAGLPEKLILDSLVPEEYNHPSSAEVDDECSICMEKYEIGDVLGRIKCTHKFHFNCIKKWLVEKNFCPNCKEIAIELDPLPPN